VACSSSDGIVKVWLITGECVRTFQSHQDGLTCVTWAREDEYLVSGGSDRTIKVWRLESDDCIATFIGHHQRVTCLTASCDGQYIISGSDDQTVKVWGIETHECLRTFKGHRNAITSVVLSQDYRYLVSASGDSTLQVYPFSFYRSESLAFKSLDWLIKLFKSHQGTVITLETMFGLCPSYLDDIFVSDDRTRTTTFLARAIELEAPDRMLQEVFKINKTACAWTNLFHSSSYGQSHSHEEGCQNILETLLKSKRERALEVVLDQIVYGYDQHNQVRMGHLPLSQASWRITPFITSSQKFTSFTSRLIKEYPQLAQNFLSKLGVVKTLSEVDARKKEDWHKSGYEHVVTLNGSLPDDCGFVVVSSDSLIPTAPIDIDHSPEQIFGVFWDRNLNPLVGFSSVSLSLVICWLLYLFDPFFFFCLLVSVSFFSSDVSLSFLSVGIISRFKDC
jgi:hypothetical protein